MFTLLATTQAGNVPAATNEDAFAAGMIVMVVLTLGMWCLINWLIVDAAKAAAPEHRTMKPGLVWLMLIPLFNVFWQFKALPAVSNSLKATLDAKGQAGGDAGRLVGLLFAWIAAVHMLEIIVTGQPPFGERKPPTDPAVLISVVLTLVNLVVIITYTVKVRRAKKMILAAG